LVRDRASERDTKPIENVRDENYREISKLKRETKKEREKRARIRKIAKMLTSLLP